MKIYNGQEGGTVIWKPDCFCLNRLFLKKLIRLSYIQHVSKYI